MKQGILSLILILSACAPMSQLRYPSARWLRDDDRKPIEKPGVREQYRFMDIAEYQFFYQLERLVDIPLQAENILGALGLPARQEALNTNNFDEVADSTWFTNRVGRRPLSLEEIRQGPNRGSGPDPAGPWIVISGKSAGISPGLVIQDSHGDRYLIKFDPAGHLNLATSAEVISTKFFYALGYNVPENYLVDFRPEILRISPKATQRDRKGKKIPLTEEDVKKIFQRLPQIGDGVYRTLASKFLEGDLIGPFSFRGKRRGDKNDRIPHEHRRELRGYRVFSSLLDHFDSRQANTLDSFIVTGPGQEGYVLHQLLDFGSTLGSSAVKPKDKLHRHDYGLNYGQVAASLGSFGGYYPDWDKAHDPELLSVAIFESNTFNPETWRPQYPNPAFQYMTVRDAFWATKILMQINDEQIAAIVKEARYLDPEAESYVTQTLIERKRKIGEAWFGKMNPLDNFVILVSSGGTQLGFDDLMIQSGLRSRGSATYRYRLIQEKGVYELLTWRETATTSLTLSPAEIEKMKPGKVYLLQLQTKREGEGHWGPLLDLMVRREGELKLLGLFRRYDS